MTSVDDDLLSLTEHDVARALRDAGSRISQYLNRMTDGDATMLRAAISDYADACVEQERAASAELVTKPTIIIITIDRLRALAEDTGFDHEVAHVFADANVKHFLRAALPVEEHDA